MPEREAPYQSNADDESVSREEVKRRLRVLIGKKEATGRPADKSIRMLETLLSAADDDDRWVVYSALLIAFTNGEDAESRVMAPALTKLRRQLDDLGLELQRETAFRVVPKGTPAPKREKNR